MDLDELLAKAGLSLASPARIKIQGLTTDSRAVKPGDLFIGLPGTQVDGGSYWPQAAQRGAAAVLLSPNVPTTEASIPLLVVPDPQRQGARLAAAYYDFPATKLQLVGVTGTNGKTTTTHIIEHLLAARQKVGLLGTLYSRWPGKTTQAEHTTPFALELQRSLAEMVAAGCQTGVMEVSSHALSQGRAQECVYEAAVFTNLTQDHLDFHQTLADYFEAKALLFSPAYLKGRAILNRDDAYGLQLLERVTDVWTYGLTAASEIYPQAVTFSPQGLSGLLVTPLGEIPFQTSLVGQFNLYNLLGAVGACLHLGLSLTDIAAGLASFSGVPGRMERVSAPGAAITVVVDYAHTPDGLENLLRATRPFVQGRLICVFGCGGDRDKTKRPLMGAITARLADLAVVTSDNPRTEAPLGILQDIVVGMNPAPAIVEVDRRQAIIQAIALAQPGDVVVIAGKGHEDYQILGREKFPFDDRVEARQALAALG